MDPEKPRRQAGREPAPLIVLPVPGIPEVAGGADLGALIVDAAHEAGIELLDNDVVVVTQKIVSKAEGRVRDVAPDDVAARRVIAEAEAVRVLRKRKDVMITETRHGFVCANSGVDASNVDPGKVVLLPADPDKSARRIRRQIRMLTARHPSVIISDTFGRAWRVGQTNVAIGVAGMNPLVDYRGQRDSFGNELKVTSIAVADELAAAAELVMGKSDGIPVAVVRGARFRPGRGKATRLVRKAGDDLFR